MDEIGERDEEEILIEYVMRALEARERGERIDLDVLCNAHPGLRPAVAEALGLSAGLQDVGRASAERDRELGRVLGGRYRLEARLGRGSMGAVFAARDLELDREVAVKVFDAIGTSDATDEERFQREAKALAALQHPNIVTIHDRGNDENGVRYLVMERLHGAPLSALLAARSEATPDGESFENWFAAALQTEGRPRCETTWLRTCVRITRDVAGALAVAHARGIQHRDVKPSNIFVTSAGETVLLDFGIAARDGDPALTTGESTLGTPWYMAPEQADRGARTGTSIDVYGATATLYHLTTGHPPYDGDAMQVLARILHEDPLPPARLKRDLPRDLCAILEKGMERDPARRYPDTTALRADLESFLEHRPVRARAIGRFGRLLRAARRSPARSSAIALAILLAIALGLVMPLWSSYRTHRDAAARDELFRTMPALIAIDGQPGAALVHELGAGSRALGSLDDLLALAPDDLPHRLWRAVLRLDRGEQDLAAEDLRELRRRAGDSAFTRALVDVYEQKGSATGDIDLTTLPAPSTDFDHFLAGFHELRNRERDGAAKRADDHLAAVADRYLPARDLRLISLCERGDREQDRALFQLVADEALRLDGIYGHPTARTLAMRGVALLALRRIPEACSLLEESDRMRPDRHGTLHNLGMAYRRLGRLDDALRCLSRALELRPTVWNTVYMLGLAEKDREDFDAALADADRLDAITVPAEVAWRKPELRATILLRRGITRRSNDAAGSRQDAADAERLFGEAAALAPKTTANELKVRAQIAAAIGAERETDALPALLALLRRTPDDAYQIANLADLLPKDGLDAGTSVALRRYLRALAIALATGDPVFQGKEQANERRERGQ
ncbi:MAG: protein kinase [Planctomycetota bacterium]